MNSIDKALEALKKGEIIIVVDDEKRENEGDFLFLADHVSAEKVNFLIKEGRGLVCIAMEEADLSRLELAPMVYNNSSSHKTQFTISVDAKEGVSTGISASDRAKTIRTLITKNSKPEELARPGHIFPLRAVDGGVLKRPGHTEAAVDLAKMAGSYPAGVICEVMREDGEMARMPELVAFAQKHDMLIISVGEIIAYRRKHEKLVEKIDETTLPTRFGTFRAIVYRDVMTDEEHVALVKGDISADESILVRVHSSCLTGDTFGSLRCDCGNQLAQALMRINEQGGVVLYLDQEGRGIGLSNKIRAYHLQDEGLDTVEANERLGFPADLRDYGIGAQILRDLGIQKMKLLTNNPEKIIGLEDYGLEVTERIPITTEENPSNKKYLETKKNKLRHLL